MAKEKEKYVILWKDRAGRQQRFVTGADDILGAAQAAADRADRDGGRVVQITLQNAARGQCSCDCKMCKTGAHCGSGRFGGRCYA